MSENRGRRGPAGGRRPFLGNRTPTRPLIQPRRPQQPGLLKQAGATAAGVAAGTVLGHSVSNMLFAPRQSGGYGQDAGNPQIPCEGPLRKFLECSQDNVDSDLNKCAEFFEKLRICSEKESQ